MRGYTINRAEENKDKAKSAILSVMIWSAILLFVFIYKMKPTERPKETEVVTTMLVNFGDNRNGAGIDEPANQEGSLAAKAEENEPEPVNTISEPKTVITPEPKPETKKTEVKDKIINGNNSKVTAPKKEDSKTNKKSTASSTTKNKAKSSATTANSKTGNGDGKGTAAIGNLIKGRGTKAGSQGTGDGIGNNGDPLGGDGNGDSKIGIDRRLVGYIPGTMGRGGAQPSHSCSAGGSITISYTVDKAGNVVSARRSGGVSDPCVVSTSVSWVKKYVKAEKASVSSTGSYKISF
ncbi:ferric siderophore ABC transporter substrate-binding protein [Chryseobacterium chendengshani]|uniref:ferric siderophore ABC transporter substrate-binding protein n=1 Tax=Chryseobacterium sp. LJ668 TaxID=2864040 RepID=UPI001C68856B|nr:ferric siderophore ABC transporter substrate-binding protein [Chryseobacterium sp. LJ668]MBW8522053.1 ferric siderophore ABC transporter substrate-binding protein [Chryseobacterium sp. LJ668]QYK17705.1 ferric siderophore ABC transporter substrate-binding protein [Chryseobacterium sp. LJ668]